MNRELVFSLCSVLGGLAILALFLAIVTRTERKIIHLVAPPLLVVAISGLLTLLIWLF